MCTFSTCSKGGPHYMYGQWNFLWQIMIYVHNYTGNDNKNKVMYKKWYTVWLTKRMVVFEFVVVLPVDTVFACYCSMVCSSIILSPPSVTIKFYNIHIYITYKLIYKKTSYLCKYCKNSFLIKKIHVHVVTFFFFYTFFSFWMKNTDYFSYVKYWFKLFLKKKNNHKTLKTLQYEVSIVT